LYETGRREEEESFMGMKRIRVVSNTLETARNLLRPSVISCRAASTAKSSAAKSSAAQFQLLCLGHRLRPPWVRFRRSPQSRPARRCSEIDPSRAPAVVPRSRAPASAGVALSAIAVAGSAHRWCCSDGRRGHGPPAIVVESSRAPVALPRSRAPTSAGATP